MIRDLIEYLSRHNPLPTLYSGSGITIAGATISWTDMVSWAITISAGLMALIVSMFTIAVAVETRRVRIKEQRALDREERRERFKESQMQDADQE